MDAQTPAPGPDEITVHVRAAGTNPVDLKSTTGAHPAKFPAPADQETAWPVSMTQKRLQSVSASTTKSASAG